ncbi:multiprotein bridging factor aMBF1 [Methanobrevibacter thaueri]|uniref:Transcription factor n=1 Tax=Methanobrevibacter thaueri TaxID=190975 RepID=A0A315XMT7_9EURY|nr:multiprotein bridging factor aMBF1 [Methanobrevibacter thaueri]MBR3197828.1 TIGR00270 family protein [Methanobrevibacter sp.]MBR6928502.1 TIGR00270 family protein [Methanobrevibacter sp.]MBR7050243.1 TIGR00270 family protein [Methanobrevibacter sp.]PWB87323.1 transcription factor [Methanobrevibacter thaueri]
MECEICGKPVPENNPIRAKIEGSVMVVCKECSKLGTVQKAPPKPKYVKQNKGKKPANTRKRNYSRNDEPSEELIEDFSFEVRKAREAKDWSREDLGRKINERVSVITRIETGKMTPDTKLTKKLEKALNIKLLEKVDNVDLNQFINSSSGERTLGNIMKIKRK